METNAEADTQVSIQTSSKSQTLVPEVQPEELYPFKLPLLLLQVMQSRCYFFTQVCSNSISGGFATSQSLLQESYFATKSKSLPLDSQICALLLDNSYVLCLSLPPFGSKTTRSSSCPTCCMARNHI